MGDISPVVSMLILERQNIFFLGEGEGGVLKRKDLVIGAG